MSAKPAQASSEEEGPGMEMAAANGMLEAIKAGDASALSAALKEHYAACKMAEGSEEAGEAYE
jgi:DNA-binding GntR family transcriptional regulator